MLKEFFYLFFLLLNSCMVNKKSLILWENGNVNLHMKKVWVWKKKFTSSIIKLLWRILPIQVQFKYNLPFNTMFVIVCPNFIDLSGFSFPRSEKTWSSSGQRQVAKYGRSTATSTLTVSTRPSRNTARVLLQVWHLSSTLWKKLLHRLGSGTAIWLMVVTSSVTFLMWVNLLVGNFVCVRAIKHVFCVFAHHALHHAELWVILFAQTILAFWVFLVKSLIVLVSVDRFNNSFTWCVCYFSVHDPLERLASWPDGW